MSGDNGSGSTEVQSYFREKNLNNPPSLNHPGKLGPNSSGLGGICSVDFVEKMGNFISTQAENQIAEAILQTQKVIIREETNGSGLGSSWYINVPRRRRSIRMVRDKPISKGFHEEGMSAELSRPSQARARPSTRRRRKSKNSDTGDSEVISPRVSRCRGRSRGRMGSDDLTQQKGKLDSSTFEQYLGYMWSGFSEERRKSFTYLDCLWFFYYSNNSFKEKVLNWIKKKDILSKDYVFVPVVQWSHWSLVIFCHLGESQQSKTRTPCILLLDSLQKTDPKRLEAGIRKFVMDIYEIDERPEDKKSIQKIPLLVPKVPQQRNGAECGNFVLYYINMFFESAPESFCINEGYPYFMKEDWFTPEGVDSFCEKLHSVCKNSAGSDGEL